MRLRDLVEATEPLGGSYTIINQGLVDAALTLRPEERRRLFEDAAEFGLGFRLALDAQRDLLAASHDACLARWKAFGAGIVTLKGTMPAITSSAGAARRCSTSPTGCAPSARSSVVLTSAP